MSKKYVMFIDETGSADLNMMDQPFTLTGVIFEHKYAIDHDGKEAELNKMVRSLKHKCFGTDQIALHLDHISRGKGQYKTIPNDKRLTFYNELPSFLSTLQFNIISVTVDKAKLKEYYNPSKDPYIVAFMHVLTSYYSFINNNNTESARIIIESRDDAQNLTVQKAFFDVFNSGTIHLDVAHHLREKVKGFIIAKKDDHLYQAGLEVADLVCNPLSRVRRGLIEANPKCMRHGEYGEKNKIFSSIKDKIYTATGEQDLRNWGFQKVPITKKKRDWVDNPVIVTN
jgi:hypothetical protein